MNKLSLDALIEKLHSQEITNNEQKITTTRWKLIKKIQSEIKYIKNSKQEDPKTKQTLNKLENLLASEIQNHKEQIDYRYQKEFMKPAAKLPTIVTMLPLGLDLQIKKFNTCLKELKLTENKSLTSAIKAFGMTLSTPVIYTYKFIKEHWYLLLLLLLLKSPKPYIEIPDVVKPSIDSVNEKDPVIDPVEEQEQVKITEEVAIPVKELVQEEVKATPKIETVYAKPVEQIEVNDKYFNTTNINNMVSDFIYGLEHNYHYFIGQYHPNVIIVHNEQEFSKAIKDITDIDINSKNAGRIYKKTLTLMPSERSIVWPEQDSTCHYFETEQELMDYIILGKDKSIQKYLTQFSKNYSTSNFSLPEKIKLNTNKLAITMGVPVTTAITIYFLYEGIQYGLAPLTNGASLALPG